MDPNAAIQDFFAQLDHIDTEDSNALAMVGEKIAENPSVYKKCIKLLMSSPMKVKEHDVAIKNIQNQILLSETISPLHGRMLKICADQSLGYDNLLHWALQNGNFQIARVLIEAGFDLNAPDEDNIYLLQYLMGFEWDETIAEFTHYFLGQPSLDKSVDMFILAIDNDKFEMAKLMIQAGFNVQGRSGEGETPYACALRQMMNNQKNADAMELVGELIKAGGSDTVSENFYLYHQHLREIPEHIEKMLKEAFKQQDSLQEIEDVNLEILSRAWLNPSDPQNKKALIACLQRYPAIVEHMPNLTTILLESIIGNTSSLSDIRTCLDAVPHLIQGQQGRELMRFAIENRHFLLAKELHKRGCDVSVPYGKSIKQDQYDSANLTDQPPWQHALNNGDDAIVAQFLLDPKGQPNRPLCKAIYVDLLERPQLCEKHSPLLNKLIELGMDVETRNSSGQTLLDIIVALPEKLPWPLVQQLLERNASLSVKSKYHLFTKAISEGQLQAASLLNQKMPMKEIAGLLDYSFLDALSMLTQQQRWVQSLLKQWTNQGLDIDNLVDAHGNTLLANILQRRDFPLAAFLIKLGADPGKSKSPFPEHMMEQLQHYAAKLESGTSAEQALREELFTKNLAHLLGDAFMQNMGNLPSNSMSFMLKIMDYFISEQSQKFSPEVLEQLKQFSRQLQQSLEISHQLDDLRQLSALDPTGPYLPLGLNQLAKRVQQQLNDLPEGEIAWLPYGWAANSVHATLIGCQRTPDGFYFHVVNTGTGVQFHELQHNLLKTYADTVRTFKIPAAKINDTLFLQQLFEPAVLGMGISVVKEQNYNENDIYSLLAPYAYIPQEEAVNLPSAWMHEQLGGGCSFRSLLAALSMTLGKTQYKEFNRLIKKEITTMAIEQNGALMQIDSEVARILSQALPRLSGHIVKGLEGVGSDELLEGSVIDLEALNELQEKMQLAIPSGRSENPVFMYQQQMPTRTEAVKHSLKPLVVFEQDNKEPENAALALPNQPPLPLSKNPIVSAEDLRERLENFAHYLTNSRNSSEGITGKFLMDLGHALLDQNGEPREKIVTELRQNPILCANVLPSLAKITQKYYEQTKNQALDNGTVSVALLSAFTVGWLLTSIAEEDKKNIPDEGKLTAYAPPWRALQKPLFAQNTPVFAPEVLPDVTRLTSFLQKAGDGQKKSLFDVNYFYYGQSGDPLFKLDNQEGDYQYLRAHLKSVSETDRMKAIEAYNKAIEPWLHKGFDNKFTQEDWVVNYCYVKDVVPPSYKVLRDLARMAMLGSPAMRSDRPVADLYGPTFINGDRNDPKGLMITYSMGFISSYYLTNRTKRDTTDFLPENSQRTLYSAESEVPLIPIAQNRVVTKYNKGLSHALLSLNAPFDTINTATGRISSKEQLIPITMLLDHFESHLDELMEPDACIFFAALQRKFSKKALYQNADEYLSFFDKSIAHFEAQWLANINLKQSQQVLLFLLEQKQRYCRQAGRTMIKGRDLLEETRQQVRKLGSDPQMAKNEDQQYLHLILLDSYNSKVPLTGEQVAEIIMVRAHLKYLLQQSGKNPVIFPQLYDSAARALALHQDEIQEHLAIDEAVRNGTFNHVLRDAGIELPGAEWKAEGFPLYSSIQADGSMFQIDILSGDIYLNGKNLVPLAHLRSDPIYKEHFGSQRMLGSQQPGYIECQDSKGMIRLITAKDRWGNPAIKEVHRKIGEAWFCHISPQSSNYPLMPSLAPKDGLQIWQKADSKECEYLIVDKASFEPLYRLDEGGCFWFPIGEKAKRYAWCDVGNSVEGQGLKAFDPATILWQPAPQADVEVYFPLLQFPHYTDMQGKNLEFTYEDGRWHLLSAPQLMIAEEQSLEGMRNIQRFLVLEDAKGKKEVMLPKLPFGKQGIQAARCEKIPMNKGIPESKNVEQNTFLAYLTMAHALTAEDYVRAMEYLKKAYSFGRYDKGQLKLLGWILNADRVKDDHSASMDAIRLYAAWLVHDNFKRNPLPSAEVEKVSKKALWGMTGNDASPDHWEAYWVAGHADEVLDKLMPHYLARRTKSHHAVGLEAILDPQELTDWGIDRRAEDERRKTLGQGRFAEGPAAQIDWLPDLFNNRGQAPLNYYTRPGDQLSKGFYGLYMLAKSPDPEERSQVEQIVQGTLYDKHPRNSAFRAVLQAALTVAEYPEGGGAAARLVDYVDRMQQSPPRSNFLGDPMYTERNHFNRLIGDFLGGAQINPLPRVKTAAKIPLAEVIPASQENKLPDQPPARSVLVFQGSTDLKPLHQLYESYFYALDVTQSQGRDSAPFEVRTGDKKIDDNRVAFLEKSVNKLNDDLVIGRKNNAALPKHSMKDPQTIQTAAQTIKDEIDDLHRQDSGRMKDLQGEMIEMARRPSADRKTRLQEEAKILSGQKAALGEKDCIALFLLGDKEEIKRLTHLESDADIDGLYQTIGGYLLLARKVDHLEKLSKNLDKLALQTKANAPSDEIDDLVQEIGDALSKQHHFQPGRDPTAFIVLEHGLNLYMKADQVEGLREMLPALEDGEFSSLFLQRIQGGGKTLIFGHMLAMMKADGYHLSIHVPASAQYGTLLYEMQHISEKVFGQKERTLQFDDDPERFTVEYLNGMRNTLVKAVNEREYINMTIETLRAMRCKYIKTRLIINDKLSKSQGIETEEIRDLEERNAILKEMLKIMRERAVFTFDEVHLAMAPNKELNMPYGEHSHISHSEATLIGKLLRLSATAQSGERQLLRLAQNQQSQQSAEDHAEMVHLVVDELFEDASWLKNLRRIKKDLSPQELTELKQFILGESQDIPNFISERVEDTKIATKKISRAKGAAGLVVLAKQMIGGGWLKERLSKNVEEHHGFSKLEIGPRISIPFIANTTAAEGSEFSDRYVMITNTLIAYIVEGLSPAQTKQLIDDYRKQARAEHLSSNEDRTPLRETAAAKQFALVCGQDLFTIDCDNESEITTIQKALLAGSTESMQMILDYAIAHELGEVEMYENQVSSHGQNTASMAKARVGYSGSLDNPNMAPPGTEIQPEMGTNGQTIDLLIEKNDDVWVIAPTSKNLWEKDTKIQGVPKYDSLFTDLISKHPDKKQIRAIIDVGCHFRGVANDDVAKMICTYLKEDNSDMQGALYFDPNPASDKLFFRHRDQPDNEPGIPLSDTRPETIEMETGYKPEQLFTHYDQNHITGVDIKQARDTRAVITWDLDTDIHKALQGGRRLRALDHGQRLISAVEPGAVPKFYAKLHRPDAPSLSLGKIQDKKILNIKDLILYAHLKEDEGQLDENLLFCLQKIETVLQQHILDDGYRSNVERERELFAYASHLFSKSIAVDLYREYAHQRKELPIEEYLEGLHTRLMEPLLPLLTGDKIEMLNKEIMAIIDQAKNDLKPTIEVASQAFQSAGLETANQNRDSTMVQFRQQVDKRTTQMENQQEAQAVRQTMTEQESDILKKHRTAEEIRFTVEQLEKPDFAVDIQTFDGANLCLQKVLPESEWGESEKINESVKNAGAEVWSADQLLASQNPSYKGLIDENILVSSNFAVSLTQRIDLFGPFRKDSFQWLLICDQSPEGQKNWKLMLISIDDAQNLQKILPNLKLERRRMALVRPKANPKVLLSAGNDISSEELESDPQLHKLMAQAFLLGGKDYELSQPKWQKALDDALPKGKHREPYLSLAEKDIFRGTSVGRDHPVMQILHKYQA